MNNEVYNFYKSIGNAGYKFYQDCVAGFTFIGGTVSSFVHGMRYPKKIRWKETLYYMDNCGSDALPIIITVGFLVGFVLAMQGVVQLEKLGAKLMVMDLVVLSIFKELGPITAAIVATGRAGSAFAAEIGTMKVTEEVDAMNVMGFELGRFLIVPKIIAMIVVMPILTIFANIAAICGGILVNFQMGISIPESLCKVFSVLTFSDYMQSVVKSIVFGVIIASVGCMRGLETEKDSQSVGRSTTSAVVTSIFILAVADTILTLIFCMFQMSD
jgi:phospholipid/cholesterol/gamma-HCH transport system permease protein